jgi:hypothetical protein
MSYLYYGVIYVLLPCGIVSRRSFQCQWWSIFCENIDVSMQTVNMLCSCLKHLYVLPLRCYIRIVDVRHSVEEELSIPMTASLTPTFLYGRTSSFMIGLMTIHLGWIAGQYSVRTLMWACRLLRFSFLIHQSLTFTVLYVLLPCGIVSKMSPLLSMTVNILSFK